MRKGEEFLSSGNEVFVEELYALYLEDPQSVDIEWRNYFASLDRDGLSFKKPAWGKKHYISRVIGCVDTEPKGQGTKLQTVKDIQKSTSEIDVKLNIAAHSLINAYRNFGHKVIQYDPLKMVNPEKCNLLDLSYYQVTGADVNKEVLLNGELNIQKAKLNELQSLLQRIYSSRIGFEFMHIDNDKERQWVQSKIEAMMFNIAFNKEERVAALEALVHAETFEHYLHIKFPGSKRFSIEGGESSIVALEEIITSAVKHTGVTEVVIGMAHRGRLNTLTRVLGKPYHAMLSEFKGELAFPSDTSIPGDVKYHLGYSNDKIFGGKNVHLSLVPNPSHLEVVNSVVLGKVRALQDLIGDSERKQVIGILLHGDSAFSGQGSVAESLYLSDLEAYKVGGTIHIIINNQVGFTTNPREARSSRYCTDVAKAIAAPVLHINGDDVEAVMAAARFAVEYRNQFKKDIFLDIVCYRKYGHNEGDEPLFTQPMMYKNISSHKTVDNLYAETLIASNIITLDEYNNMRSVFKAKLDEELAKAQSYKPKEADWLKGRWSAMKRANIERSAELTGVKASTLRSLGIKLAEIPQGFNVNTKIAKQMEARKHMAESGDGIDWGMGEALAFATLLNEGYPIRVSGQDTKRGTFSHRNAVLFDQSDEKQFISLNHLIPNQNAFLQIYNSNLSEFAVMGFEYGYSIASPTPLVIWEAQFGDFANGAQVVIDQYLASGEAKWLKMSGLVLLLPHAYEGNGPEHSSARLERFLELCASDNMQVVNCSTPASFFHVLRRQLHREFRKPLIVMTPKSLLRHKYAISSFEEMKEGTTFMPVLEDKGVAQVVKKLVICSGKVYYDLYEERLKNERKDVALIRLEQFYPFPESEIKRELDKYTKAEVIWCQEEHENMGGYYFVARHINPMLNTAGRSEIKYIGRLPSASPATGYMKLHNAEYDKIVSAIFN